MRMFLLDTIEKVYARFNDITSSLFSLFIYFKINLFTFLKKIEHNKSP